MSSFEFNKSPLTSPGATNKTSPITIASKVANETPSICLSAFNEANESTTSDDKEIPMIEVDLPEVFLLKNSEPPPKDKYCIVDFDFQPENKNELGTFYTPYISKLNMN